MHEIDRESWLQGVLTAQGYLLEVLLGAQLAAMPNPAGALEQARAALQTQIRFDMHIPPHGQPQTDHLAIQSAASAHLDEIFDRLLSQIQNTTK
jgi:hypothetical protein